MAYLFLRDRHSIGWPCTRALPSSHINRINSHPSMSIRAEAERGEEVDSSVGPGMPQDGS